MSDPRVQSWRQCGHVYLWRDRDHIRNSPGWECVFDDEGRTSLIELLDLMLDAQWNAGRSIKITPPTPQMRDLPDRAGERWMSPESIKIVPVKEESQVRLWRWSGDLKQPTLTLGGEMLVELRGAVERTAQYGDFCIPDRDAPTHGFDFETMSIWFWPA